jgi:glycosyltransferase involved in cell wall biosynthesis
MIMPLVSVVVPAHNEEAVVGQGLDRLLSGAKPGELDVIVVANACTDGTAQVARRRGVRVLETAIAGKGHALKIGDAACRVFPRLYVDADVELTLGAVRALMTALQTPGALACAPEPDWELDGVSGLARRVHRVHNALIGPHRALAGVGVYGLTEQGHDRVFPLPDVIADDEWVHRSFDPSERRVVTQARSVVRPARTLRAHLRRRVRVRVGNRQLDELGRPSRTGPLEMRGVATILAGRTVGIGDVLVYLAVKIVERALTARQLRRSGEHVGWAGDDRIRSSQVPR